MTERKPDTITSRTSTPTQTDVSRVTVVDAPSVPSANTSVQETYEQRVSGPAGEQVVHSEHVRVPSEATRRGSSVTRITQVIYFIVGIINVLLVMRFLLLLLGANEVSPFVTWIYGLSRPFILPFRGIFAEPDIGASVIDVAALVGIAIYSLLAYGLARIVALLYAPVAPTVST